MRIIIAIIIAFLAVVVIFSGCVTDDQKGSGTQINSKESFMSALTSGAELKCLTDANVTSNAIYITKDKYLAVANTPETGNYYAIIDLKEKMVYAWADKQNFSPDQLTAMGIKVEPGKKIGIKKEISQIHTKEITADFYEPEWKCELSTYAITLPSDYQFVDQTKFYASATTNGATK